MRQILLIALMTQLVYGIGYSPLRLGSDLTSNDVSIQYFQQYSNYFLYFSSKMDFVGDFIVCFRLRPVQTISNESCDLTNSTGNFDCLQLMLISDDGLPDQYNKWISTPDFINITNNTSFTPTDVRIDQEIGLYYVSLTGLDVNGNKNFSFVGSKNAIFEVISASGISFYNHETYKHNFMITFYQNFYDNSDNLLLQRQVLCYPYGVIINLIFLGGGVRDGKNVYFLAFVNYHQSLQTEFFMWQGLSFSKNKAQRDMVGVYPSRGQFNDLFSLYASAPYEDISSNIKGSQDWSQISSSNALSSNNMSWFYFTHINRFYDTGDTDGDQIIMNKINSQFCYAAYFNFTFVDNIDYYSTNKNYMHQILKCFKPDLTLNSQSIYFLILISITLVIL